eukprot:2378696-Prymnesium_polylepis.1
MTEPDCCSNRLCLPCAAGDAVTEEAQGGHEEGGEEEGGGGRTRRGFACANIPDQGGEDRGRAGDAAALAGQACA